MYYDNSANFGSEGIFPAIITKVELLHRDEVNFFNWMYEYIVHIVFDVSCRGLHRNFEMYLDVEPSNCSYLMTMYHISTESSVKDVLDLDELIGKRLNLQFVIGYYGANGEIGPYLKRIVKFNESEGIENA